MANGSVRQQLDGVPRKGPRWLVFTWWTDIEHPWLHADLPPRGSIDRVLNNPPFHENHAIGDATAWQMFTESRDVLQPGGELWVVGNRHLAYHAKLKRLFGKCDLVASDARFVVLRASRAEGPP